MIVYALTLFSWLVAEEVIPFDRLPSRSGQFNVDQNNETPVVQVSASAWKSSAMQPQHALLQQLVYGTFHNCSGAGVNRGACITFVSELRQPLCHCSRTFA